MYLLFDIQLYHSAVVSTLEVIIRFFKKPIRANYQYGEKNRLKFLFPHNFDNIVLQLHICGRSKTTRMPILIYLTSIITTLTPINFEHLAAPH